MYQGAKDFVVGAKDGFVQTYEKTRDYFITDHPLENNSNTKEMGAPMGEVPGYASEKPAGVHQNTGGTQIKDRKKGENVLVNPDQRGKMDTRIPGMAIADKNLGDGKLINLLPAPQTIWDMVSASTAQSRINVRNGDAEVKGSGLEYAWKKHGGE